MASRTLHSDARVVELNVVPLASVVANLAVVRADYMSVAFLMAGITTCSDVSVVKERVFPIASVMAILAIIRALNVIAGLTRQRDIIVATDATSGDAEVVETSSKPTISAVAQLAVVGALHVSGILALGVEIVVTNEAATPNRAVVDPRRYPGIHEMAVIAVIGADDVTHILGSLCSKSAAVMAQGTARRRAFKNTAFVAFLASHALVGVYQWKACAEVIKILPLLRPCAGDGAPEKHGKEHDEAVCRVAGRRSDLP